MSPGRRYFVLSDALPKSQVPHMLGRVVEDKLLPLRSFIPFDFGADVKLHHNPENIIPNILPEPAVWSTRNDFFSHTSDWSLGTGLADLIGVEQTSSTEKGVSLNGGEVKSYSLSNTLQHFERLMANEAYSQDVRQLLKRTKTGHAYFVTGFLTANQGIISEFRLKSRKSSLEVTFPLLEAAGLPTTVIGGAGNPQIKPSTGQSQRLERSMKIIEEMIIAVSYDVIRSSRSLDSDSKSFLKKSIINAGPKRAKPKHLAFAGDQLGKYDHSNSSDSDGEEDAGWFEKPDSDEIMFVNTDMFGDARFNEPSDVLSASFSI